LPEESRSSIVGEVWSVDLADSKVASLGGSRYFASAMDDASGLIVISFGSTKNLVFDAELDEIRRIAPSLSMIQSDEAKEIIKKCKSLNVKHKISLPHDINPRSKSERCIRTVKTIARTLLLSSGLPHQLWPEAMSHGISIRNWLYSKSANQVPIQSFANANVYPIEPFGRYAFGEEVVFQRIEKTNNVKTFDQSRGTGFYLGNGLDNRLQYGTTSSARVYLAEINLVVIRDIVRGTGRMYKYVYGAKVKKIDIDSEIEQYEITSDSDVNDSYSDDGKHQMLSQADAQSNNQMDDTEDVKFQQLDEEKIKVIRNLPAAVEETISQVRRSARNKTQVN
jgi:hypothetical protein